MPLKNAAVCAVSRARIAGFAYHRVPVDQKKELSFPLCVQRCLPRIQRISRPRFWNWTSSGRLCSKKHTTPGFGLPSVERAGKWSPAIGDRSKQTCQRLWEAIAEGYRQGHCETSFWATYAAVIPEQQHTAVGKETGETAHVERWNNTMRQRLARFVRMTLSFSKSVVMHEACLLLFLPRSNTERAILLK